MTAHIADVRSSFIHNCCICKSGLTQSGAKQWCFKLAAKNFIRVYLRTHLKQGSDLVLFQIRLNSGLLWRRHEETVVPRRSFQQQDEIMRWAGVIRPSRGVSATEMCKMPPSGAACGATVSSDALRQVRSRRLWARLIVEDSARDHPQFVASLTLWRQLPCRNQWHGSSVTELTNLPLTGCQQCEQCHRHSQISAGAQPSPAQRAQRDYVACNASIWTWSKMSALINCATTRALTGINAGASRPANYCRQSSTSLLLNHYYTALSDTKINGCYQIVGVFAWSQSIGKYFNSETKGELVVYPLLSILIYFTYCRHDSILVQQKSTIFTWKKQTYSTQYIGNTAGAYWCSLLPLVCLHSNELNIHLQWHIQ